MAAAPTQKSAIKRLMFDQEELTNSPVANVSAVPLEDNMFEWHCNIRQDDIIFHLILFFPQNYPYNSPSAEFVPQGFQYRGGATKPGKKGTQVCLNIFSDFANIHTEWASEKGLGWSPGYTVQTILMNVIAFLAETSHSTTHDINLKISKNFSCPDCGHKYKEPFPSLEEVSPGHEEQGISKGKGGKGKGKGKGKTSASTTTTASDEMKKRTETDSSLQIVDYISKEIFTVSKPASVDDLFGYGLVVSGPSHRPAFTTPCEFISGRSFYGMKKSMNVVHSVMKEEIKFFLPLYIHKDHGSQIKEEFEKTLMKVAEIMPKCNPKKTPMAEMVLKTIPNLMSATVVEFSKGTQHTSDNSLNGYFALHRLLLWALDTYPELQAEVEERLKKFVEDESNRSKKQCPHIGEWLMLLVASQKYRWTDVADAYLSESWKRNVMWYVKEDSKLGFLDTPQKYRLEQTLSRTAVSRKLLAFQVLFLDIALPEGMSRDKLKKRYDDNLGFPTSDMVKKMKEACTKINTQMETYADWFSILKLPVPSDDEIYTRLVKAVRFSILTDGYHWSFWKTGGGWGEVLRKYADMKNEHKEAMKKAAAEKKDSETAMDVDEPQKTSKGKATAKETKAASRGRSGSRGRGGSRGASSKAATGRGRKRKAESDSEDDEDEIPSKAQRGRGRGRGAAAKRKR